MLKDRLKEVRKNNPNGKTQDSFAEFLGISKQNVSSYEMGRRSPSEAVIKLICEKCNVNEQWLRNGTGEMFEPITKDDEISKLFGEVLKEGNDDFKRRLITSLAKLDNVGWEKLENLIDNISTKK